MPNVERDFRLRWEVKYHGTPGFAGIDDLHLNDTFVAANIDRQRYLDLAWLEIEATLGELYEVPIGQDLPEASRTILTMLHSMLATSWLLMELHGNETFALWLRSEFDRKMQLVLDGRLRVDGLERRPDLDTLDPETGLSTSVPLVLTKDSRSAFDVFEQFAHGGDPLYGGFTPGASQTGR